MLVAPSLEGQNNVLAARIDELSKDNRSLKERNQQLKQRNQQLEQKTQEQASEIERLKGLLNEKGASKGAKRPKFSENYSLSEQKRKKKRRRHKSSGRRPQSAKEGLVNQDIDVYGDDEPKACILHRYQYAWRIIEGKAKYVRYAIYGLPEAKLLPFVPGLRNSRSEYGLEIILMVAFLHYWIGISIDHVCDVLRFFTGLELPKSQADSLLSQLSQDWSEQYDTIAELLALQLVIYIDETGWKVGKRACYTWAFSTAMHVLFRCGVGRGKAEAQALLGETFEGIGVSDNYGAYKTLFSQHQLCWAHLLRKAIKLMLQHPEQTEYAEFFQGLYGIYQQAVRWQRDGRLSRGRAQKAEHLQQMIRELCELADEELDKEQTSSDHLTFIHLQKELVNGIKALFVFVEHPEVEPTNNRSERNVRREAEIRKSGRTSKSDVGAKRRSIIMTVLSTLDTRFERFTLEHLLTEVMGWIEKGRSIFEQELDDLHQANAPPV